MSFYGKSIFGSNVAQAPRAVGCSGFGLVAIDHGGSRGIVIYGVPPQRTPVVSLPRQATGIFGMGNSSPDGIGE